MSEAPERPNGAESQSEPEAPSEPEPPRAWRIAGAILALPFIATVVVPGTIVATGDASVGLGLGGALAALAIVFGSALICAGVGVFVWTVRLFASAGRGTLAPWDPPARLVVAGPYRHMRHPMITGVALVLAGEAVALGSAGIGVWLVAFIAVNAIYLPLVEEPALRRRFGRDYDRYAANGPAGSHGRAPGSNRTGPVAGARSLAGL